MSVRHHSSPSDLVLRRRTSARSERSTPISESALFRGMMLTVERQDRRIAALESELTAARQQVAALINRENCEQQQVTA